MDPYQQAGITTWEGGSSQEMSSQDSQEVHWHSRSQGEEGGRAAGSEEVAREGGREVGEEEVRGRGGDGVNIWMDNQLVEEMMEVGEEGLEELWEDKAEKAPEQEEQVEQPVPPAVARQGCGKLDKVMGKIRGQLERNRYERILSCLKENYGAGFMGAVSSFIFSECKEESKNLSKQPLPSYFNKKHLEEFNYPDFYMELAQEAPLLHSAVRGALATHYTFDEVTGSYGIILSLCHAT